MKKVWLGRVLGVAVLSLAGASSCDDDNNSGNALGIPSTADDGSGGGGGGGSGSGSGTGGTGSGSGTGTGTGTGSGTGSGTGAGTAIQGVAVFSAVEATNIVLTIHQGEVLQAQVALQKAVAPEVKQFAQHMIDEHGASITRVQAMVPGSAPAGDPTSALLAHEAQLVTADLQALPPEQFDLAYMTVQVSGHSKALGMTDAAIVPSVRVTGDAANGIDVRALQGEMGTFRAAVIQHVIESLQIQQRLRTNAAGAGGGGAGSLPPGGTGNG